MICITDCFSINISVKDDDDDDDDDDVINCLPV